MTLMHIHLEYLKSSQKKGGQKTYMEKRMVIASISD